jgi:eukaryotic-like serine/threonine-protein kinase
MKKALVVGIDRYNRSRPLRFCSNDATYVAGLLDDINYGFDVKLLLNEDVTRSNLKSNIKNLFTGNPELVLFYFAGHGVKDSMSAYLATYDESREEPGVDLDFLTKAVKNLAGYKTQVLVILDCCHSGALQLQKDIDNLKTLNKTDIVSLEGEAKIIIAACEADKNAIEDDSLEHGIFTKYLIDGLFGEAADSDGKVNAINLYSFVQKSLEKLGVQTTTYKGDHSGQIILGSGFKPKNIKVPPEEEIKRIENHRQYVVEAYYTQYKKNDLDNWRASGYSEACIRLEPILAWFEEESNLVNNSTKLSYLRDSIGATLTELAILQSGMRTPLGTIIKPLGSGGFGKVWQLEKYDGQKRAYKVYHPDELSDNEKTSRFRHGFAAMKQLDHPFIVKVYSLTEVPLGFEMQYIDGSNLETHLAGQNDIDFSITLKQLLIVADCLRYAHDKDVIHRDVKPGNIIMMYDIQDNFYYPYLTDFDLAYHVAFKTQTHASFGTEVYRSPEQARNARSPEVRKPTTDVYSFGQLMYYFACKTHPEPFAQYSRNAQTLRQRIRSMATVQPIDKFVQLYEDCIKEKAKDRKQNFDEVHKILLEILTLLEDESDSRVVPQSDFVDELKHFVSESISEKLSAGNVIYSLSKTINISVEIKKRTYGLVDIIFHVNSELSIDAGSHGDGRRILFQRIETALSVWNNVELYPGSNSPFQVRIRIKDVTLTTKGVKTCGNILQKVIATIQHF